MIRLLSGIRFSANRSQSLLFRRFSSDISTNKHFGENNKVSTETMEPEAEEFIHKDWYRTPQQSDGERCIMPDYPEVPFQSYQNRDPYGKYTDPQSRRNFGEPVHERFDVLGTQSFDVETTYSIRYMLTGVAIAGGTFIGAVQLLNYLDDQDGWRRDVAERELPYLHKYQMAPPSKQKEEVAAQ